MAAKFSAWNLFKLISYGKFGFSRPDLDGNKLAKGMSLARKARKARDREMLLTKGRQLFFFEFKSVNPVLSSQVKHLLFALIST